MRPARDSLRGGRSHFQDRPPKSMTLSRLLMFLHVRLNAHRSFSCADISAQDRVDRQRGRTGLCRVSGRRLLAGLRKASASSAGKFEGSPYISAPTAPMPIRELMARRTYEPCELIPEQIQNAPVSWLSAFFGSVSQKQSAGDRKERQHCRNSWRRLGCCYPMRNCRFPSMP